MLSAFAFMALYIVLFGVAALLEQPIAHGLDAFQLDALLRIGAAVLAIAVLLILLGPSLPGWAPSLAGMGIGLISGSGSLCYCVALDHLPADLAACLANGYLVVTVVLGVVVLHEPLTLITLAGLALTIGGAIVLSLPRRATTSTGPGSSVGGSRFGLLASRAQPPRSSPTSSSPSASGGYGYLLGIVWVAGYIVLVGLGAFLEKLALRQAAPLQLNALVAIGMAAIGCLAVGAAHLGRRHHSAGVLGPRRMWLPALGIGLMIGVGSVFYYLALAHLPVSIAAALANAYVLVTVALAVPVFHQRMSWQKAVGILAMLAGVILLTLRVRL